MVEVGRAGGHAGGLGRSTRGPSRDAQTSRRAAAVPRAALRAARPGRSDAAHASAPSSARSSTSSSRSRSTGQPPSDVTPALDDARRRRILWVDEDASRCSFTHDKLRETLLGRLDCRRAHGPAPPGAALIERDRPEPGLRAGVPLRRRGRAAARPAVRARGGRAARGRHALDVALDALPHRRTRRASTTRPALAAPIAEGLGDVLTLKGDYTEASACLEQALALTDRSRRARGARRQARRRRVQDRRPGPRPPPPRGRAARPRSMGPAHGVAWCRALKEVIVQAAAHAARRACSWLAGRSRAPSASSLAIRMYSRLAYVYWFSAGKVPCAWAHLREMNLAERYPPTLGAGPGVLRACAGDDDGAVVLARHRLRPTLVRDPRATSATCGVRASRSTSTAPCCTPPRATGSASSRRWLRPIRRPSQTNCSPAISLGRRLLTQCPRELAASAAEGAALHDGSLLVLAVAGTALYAIHNPDEFKQRHG